MEVRKQMSWISQKLVYDILDSFLHIYQVWFILESKSSQGWLKVCTKCGNLYKLQTLQNNLNLNFSLCIILFVCYRVATLEDD